MGKSCRNGATYLNILPWSQFFPENHRPTHVHWYPPLVFWHIPPFLQGLLTAHSSTSAKSNNEINSSRITDAGSIKHEVYGRRQTKKITSDLFFYSLVVILTQKIETCLLLFTAHTNILILVYRELKTDGRSFNFCRLPFVVNVMHNLSIINSMFTARNCH